MAPDSLPNADRSARSTLVYRLRPLVAMLGPHRRLIALAVLNGIVNQLLTLASAGAGAWLVGRAITGAAVHAVIPGLILLSVLVLPTAVTAWLDSLFCHVAAFRVLADIRGRVYEAFERLSPAYMLEHRSGDLGSAAIADVEQLELFFAHTLSPLVVAATVPVAVVIALAFIHLALALVLLPVLILLATVPGWLRRQAEVQGDRLRAALGDLQADVIDTLQGLREIVSFGGQQERMGRVQASSRELLTAKRSHGRRSGVEHAATDGLAAIGALAVLVVAAALVHDGSLSGSLLPLAVILSATAFVPVIKVTDVARELNQVSAAAERVAAIVGATPAVSDLVHEAPRGAVEPRVEFCSVTFRYRSDLRSAVASINFQIEPGETVALVGHSGAGKSTCASLLLRFWDVTSGKITIGGYDVRGVPQDSLRNLVTLVPQDVYLFNISFRENIRLARPEASDAEVVKAARKALADDFIRSTPDGYDTLAGELGSRLSGGQRQRIAIARALLKDSPVLVLDEAVSNLDVESEREVAAAMKAASSGRTTLVIAHRLSTIRTADRIVVLEQGRVVESGCHEDLMQRDGAYRHLVATQADARLS